MRLAIYVLTFFGMAWGFAALQYAGAHGVLLALSPLIAVAILGISLRGLPTEPVTREQMARNRKIVRRWSLVEGIAMVAAVILLQAAGAQRHIPSVFAVIVGVHFLPMAIGFPQPVFYGTAMAMILAGLLSLIVASAQLQGEIATTISAIALWSSALGIMLFYRNFQRGPSKGEA